MAKTFRELDDWECFIYRVENGFDEHGNKVRILNKIKVNKEIDLGSIKEPKNKDIVRIEWTKKQSNIFDTFRQVFSGK